MFCCEYSFPVSLHQPAFILTDHSSYHLSVRTTRSCSCSISLFLCSFVTPQAVTLCFGFCDLRHYSSCVRGSKWCRLFEFSVLCSPRPCSLCLQASLTQLCLPRACQLTRERNKDVHEHAHHFCSCCVERRERGRKNSRKNSEVKREGKQRGKNREENWKGMNKEGEVRKLFSCER